MRKSCAARDFKQILKEIESESESENDCIGISGLHCLHTTNTKYKNEMFDRLPPCDKSEMTKPHVIYKSNLFYLTFI